MRDSADVVPVGGAVPSRDVLTDRVARAPSMPKGDALASFSNLNPRDGRFRVAVAASPIVAFDRGERGESG